MLYANDGCLASLQQGVQGRNFPRQIAHGAPDRKASACWTSSSSDTAIMRIVGVALLVVGHVDRSSILSVFFLARRFLLRAFLGIGLSDPGPCQPWMIRQISR